jgi:DNA-directed RNA polymerase subunit beta'
MGLKENVITGNLIPAGTGMREFEDIVVGSKEEFDLLMASRDVLQFDEEE